VVVVVVGRLVVVVVVVDGGSATGRSTLCSGIFSGFRVVVVVVELETGRRRDLSMLDAAGCWLILLLLELVLVLHRKAWNACLHLS
jgi:hypothetical protein